MKTDQGIDVVEAGAKYVPYCNVCGWKSGTSGRSIPEAATIARAHAEAHK